MTEPSSLTVPEAAALIRAGGVVAFPTETVYGLGANALDAAAVRRVFELKGRPAASPLIVHVASIGMAREIVAQWPPPAERLADRWWPGPLTMVLPKRPIVPDIVTAGLPTVGVRVPDHPVALDLIRAAGVPIAAPSANLFAGLSPTTAEHVRAAFGDQVPVIDGGPCRVGIESTVIAVDGGRLTLLRPGMIAFPEIERAAANPDAAHPAPGMHARHYSPRAPVRLVEAPSDSQVAEGAYLWRERPAAALRSVQMPRDPDAYAARLYAALHEVDAEGWPFIAIELPPDQPEWAAVRDRLLRAASGGGQTVPEPREQR